jgi:hypothetical protein
MRIGSFDNVIRITGTVKIVLRMEKKMDTMILWQRTQSSLNLGLVVGQCLKTQGTYRAKERYE